MLIAYECTWVGTHRHIHIFTGCQYDFSSNHHEKRNYKLTLQKAEKHTYCVFRQNAKRIVRCSMIVYKVNRKMQFDGNSGRHELKIKSTICASRIFFNLSETLASQGFMDSLHKHTQTLCSVGSVYWLFGENKCRYRRLALLSV